MNERIEKLRREIDRVDQQMLRLLRERSDVVTQIGLEKKQNGHDVVDDDRWETHLKRIQREAKENDLDEKFVSELWNSIHEYSCRMQKELKSLEETHERL